MTISSNFNVNGATYTQVYQWKRSEGGNGNYYAVMVTNASSWDEYDAQAKMNGGHLLTINSREEQQFLESISATLVTMPAVLGAKVVDGTMRWVAGPESNSTVGYKNFLHANATEPGPIFVAASDWSGFKWQSFDTVWVNNVYNKNIVEFEENSQFAQYVQNSGSVQESPDNGINQEFYQAVWTRLQQTTQRETGYAVKVANDDTIIVGGYTLGDLHGDTNQGGSDGFLAKYSANGDLLWSQLLGGPGGDAVAAVGTDKDNNVYALVGLNSNYGPDPVPAAGVSGTSYKVSKFSPSGSLLSEVSIPDNLAGRSLTVTPNGDVLATGSLGMWPNIYVSFFSSSYIDSGGSLTSGFWKDTNMSFGWPSNVGVGSTFSDNSFYVGGSAGYDGFVAKYDLNGNKQWMKSIAATNLRSEVNAVAHDAFGSVYVAGLGGDLGGGYTLGKVIDNATQPTTDEQRANGRFSSDSFLAKYDQAGNRLWLKQFGTDGDDSADALAVDSLGNIYVGGYTGRTYGNTAVVTTDARPYLKVFDANGEVVWTKIFQNSVGNVLSMSADSQGFVYASGMIEGDLNDAIALDNSGRNSFLMKFAYLTGTKAQDTLVGSAGADEIYALDGNDTVYAGLGDDLIIGGDGKGNDKYYGGAGADTVKYTSATWGITVDLSRGTAASLTNPNLRGNRDAANIGADRLYEIENVTAGNYNDVLSGNQLANEIKGEDGDDRIDGKSGNDVLYGGAGNDSLTGGTGADVMLGGAGDDTYEVDSLNDTVTEMVGQGIDTIRTQLRSYTLGNHVENVTYTGWLNSTLIGNSLDNQITGGRGADTLDGGGGNDTLIGGAGDDIYLLTSEHVGTVTIVEAARGGIDSVYGDLETYTLGSHLENYYNDLSIRNGNSIQYVVIHGNSLNNTLSTYETKESAEKFFGLAGNDTLLGGAGDDYLSGGIGRDRLTGGTGADKFVFDTTPNSRTNADIITDFSRSDGDELVFDDDVFTMLREGVTKDYLRINRTGRAQDADDYLVLNSTNGKLFYDADGNGRGAAIEIATLTGVNTLSHDDFFII